MREDSRLQQCDAGLLSRIAKTPSLGPEDHTTATGSSTMHRDRAAVESAKWRFASQLRRRSQKNDPNGTKEKAHGTKPD